MRKKLTETQTFINIKNDRNTVCKSEKKITKTQYVIEKKQNKKQKTHTQRQHVYKKGNITEIQYLI